MYHQRKVFEIAYDDDFWGFSISARHYSNKKIFVSFTNDLQTHETNEDPSKQHIIICENCFERENQREHENTHAKQANTLIYMIDWFQFPSHLVLIKRKFTQTACTVSGHQQKNRWRWFMAGHCNVWKTAAKQMTISFSLKCEKSSRSVPIVEIGGMRSWWRSK